MGMSMSIPGRTSPRPATPSRARRRVRRGEVAADEAQVVLLLAVIRQWVALDLASPRAAIEGVGGEKQVVHSRLLLEQVQDLLHAFVQKRDRPDLDGHGTFHAYRSLPRVWPAFWSAIWGV
jgi:hypothetical protein